MEELLGLLVELQELCKRRRGLDVPGQCLATAEGAGLGAPAGLLLSTILPINPLRWRVRNPECRVRDFEPDFEGNGGAQTGEGHVIHATAWRMGVKLEKAAVQAELGPQQQAEGGGAALRQWHWQDSRTWAVRGREESGGAIGDFMDGGVPKLSWGLGE